MRFGDALCLGAIASLTACRGVEPRGGEPHLRVVATVAQGMGAEPTRPLAVRAAPTTDESTKSTTSEPPPPAASSATCETASVELDLPHDSGELRENAAPEREASGRGRARSLLGSLRAEVPASRCCFEPWAKRELATEGRAVLAFTIDARGTLRQLAVDASRSTVSEPGLEACLRAHFERVRFPASQDGRDTAVEYPVRARAAR